MGVVQVETVCKSEKAVNSMLKAAYLLIYAPFCKELAGQSIEILKGSWIYPFQLPSLVSMVFVAYAHFIQRGTKKLRIEVSFGPTRLC